MLLKNFRSLVIRSLCAWFSIWRLHKTLFRFSGIRCS